MEGGSGRIIIDPFLSGNPLARVKPEAIRVDHILLTHGHGDHIGDALQIAKANGAVIIAHHGSMAPDGTYTGNPCGYLVSMDGKTLYHPGDTALFLDMKLIGEMNSIFDVIDVDPAEFARAVQAKGLKARLLPIGQSLEY